MKRYLLIVVFLVVGLGTGALAVMLASPQARPTPGTPAPSTVTVPSVPPTSVAVPVPANDLFLVWTSGGLPEGLAREVGALPGVENVAEVRSDTVYLAETRDDSAAVVDAPAGGFLIPIEVFAVDPNTYQATLPPSGRAFGSE
jgi:hypothetical protein